MPSSRRRFLATCGVAACTTAGCLSSLSAPDIPRQTQILEARTTIEPNDYRTWAISNLRTDVDLAPVDGSYVFSYEFVVERGPAVLLAVTTRGELDTRAETGGAYRMWRGTRTHGQRGATSEDLPVELMEVLVADNQDVDAEEPDPDREAATVHVQAYLSEPGDD